MSELKSIHLNSLPGPHDISRVVLPNGITLLSRSNFNSPSVVISGYLNAGSLFDPGDKLSLAYFTSLGLMRGNHNFNFQQIYDRLESAGASLGFGASVHTTSFGGRALVEDLPLLLQTLSESLRYPTFPGDQLERLRARLMTGLAMRAQDTAEMASLTFDDIIFPNHPYGRPEDGYIETVQNVSRDDLVEFHRRHYGPTGMVLVVVGAVSPQEVQEKVLTYLGDWSNPQQEAAHEMPEIKPLSESVRKHITIPEKSQTDLVIGTLGPKRKSPDYLAASLGNSILGQFGMMGRIGDIVREQAGLAYHASTSLNAWISSGSWEVSAGVNPANLQKAIDLILSEMKRYVNEPVSNEELSDNQANFIGRLPLSLESNSGVANSLLNLERFQLGLDYYQLYPAKIEAVTPAMVLETARRYIDPDKMAIVSAGVAL
ncbi:MAG: insulinase family protein [Anaerolineae bacterium]|nr:insulinase family protein [Anaerolineae bacterium]